MPNIKHDPVAIVDERIKPKYLNDKEKLVKIFDITYLPTYSEIVDVFPWLDPTFQPEPFKDFKNEQQLYFISKHIDYVTPDNFLFFVTNDVFYQCDILTYEYVYSFSNYLSKRVKSILEVKRETMPILQQKVTILEIGAGTGRLSHFIEYFLTKVFSIPENILTVKAIDYQGVVGDQSKRFFLFSYFVLFLLFFCSFVLLFFCSFVLLFFCSFVLFFFFSFFLLFFCCSFVLLFFCSFVFVCLFFCSFVLLFFCFC